MIAVNKYQSLLDRCTGKAPKPYVRPKPMTSIERNQLDPLDSIQDEYHNTFGKQEKV